MQIQGTVKNIVFRNSTNGWTVLTLVDQTGEEITAVGSLALCNVGEEVILTGDYVEHPSYGLQFKATDCKCLAPASLVAIEQYLASGCIKGVGKATARQIVEAFGMDTLSVLENDPQRLTLINGIGQKRAATIAASFIQQSMTRDSVLALQGFGLTPAQAMQLHQKYGTSCVARVEENPYLLIQEVDSIGFTTADQIARRLGIEPDDPLRIQAGVTYVLRWARQEGHTYLPIEKLLEVSCNVLMLDEGIVGRNLESMILDGLVYVSWLDQTQAVFLPALHYLESEIAAKLLSVFHASKPNNFLSLTDELHYLEQSFQIQLAPQQREAVLCALEQNLAVITGGPGTGKTTIIRFIIHLLEKMGLDFALCAPTGRAAKRMSEATGTDACTLHRLLEYGMGAESFGRNENNLLFYDVIIIDEMSMVDAYLMHAFLKAVPVGTRLIFVGDVDQLPSIGAGNVLHDVIFSSAMPVIALTEIFRQSERSAIVTNAHRINEGVMPEFDSERTDFLLEECNIQEQVLQRVMELCKNTHSDLATNDPLKDVQVLAPMKKGVLGVKNLNVQLQHALNPPDHFKKEKTFGMTVFREGDKVMQIKNNYSQEWTKAKPAQPIETGRGVFNGDLGTVMRIDTQESSMHVLFDDGRLVVYDFTQLEELDLAYCISIHKSQGSEFPIVLLPLMSGPPMLMTRNLLYTAVTRARSQVYIVGRLSAVEQMVHNTQKRKRYTALGWFLKQLSELY